MSKHVEVLKAVKDRIRTGNRYVCIATKGLTGLYEHRPQGAADTAGMVVGKQLLAWISELMGHPGFGTDLEEWMEIHRPDVAAEMPDYMQIRRDWIDWMIQQIESGAKTF